MGIKLVTSSGLVLLGLLAAVATGQSAAPAVSPAQQAKSATTPAAASGPAAGAEQQAADPNCRRAGDDALTTLRTTTNEVNVVFTVTDKHGRRITDLKQSDFHVLDDNKPPQEIRSFHAETNLPLAGRTADRCQQLRARPVQVRAAIRHRVSESDDSSGASIRRLWSAST